MNGAMRVNCLLLLLFAGACGDSPFKDDEKSNDDENIQACEPLPTNNSAETAVPLMLGEEKVAQFCKAAVPRPWFRHTGNFADKTKFRLTVRWKNGLEAEDIDFVVGRLNGDGSFFAGDVVSGSCSQPAGQDENCVTIVPASVEGQPVDAIYVRVSDSSPQAEEEVFRITLSEVTQ